MPTPVRKERPSSKAKSRRRPAIADSRDETSPTKSSDPVGEKSRRRTIDKRKSQVSQKTTSPSKRIPKLTADECASSRSSNALSVDSLAKLNALNHQADLSAKGKAVIKEKRVEKEARKNEEKEARKLEQKEARKHEEKVVTGRVIKERGKHRRRDSYTEPRKKRIVSGAILEEGKGQRGGFIVNDEGTGPSKLCWAIVGAIILLLVVLIPVGVLVIGKQNGGGDTASTSVGGSSPSNANLNGINQGDIPAAEKGGYLDPFTWFDTKDFNVTFTGETVGGLPLIGLDSTWNDSAKANPYVPALNETFNYGQMPIRGVNLGGWLSVEPFITPSLFSPYESRLNVVDEYSLCQHLGPQGAASTLEKHYATFITEQTFIDVRAAGFDHVRIPFSYWAVTTYPGDPYVPKISWRYLLRGIEYARKYGLRVNLDLHAVPGGQNGWNHSGRQGVIGWINGVDGPTNAQRSIDIHNQLSTFFAQPRYKNIIALYGLVNEPKMTVLPVDKVLTWYTTVVPIIRNNGITQPIVFGDGFLGLEKWQGKLQGIQGLVMDAHQYIIFNKDQIAFTHQTKLNFACSGWTGQMKMSTNVATGYVPTILNAPVAFVPLISPFHPPITNNRRI